MQPWWLVYGVVGWGFSSWLIVFFSKPDPGPDPMAWVAGSLAGIIGGVLGAAVAHASSSDPMPLLVIVSAIAGAAVLLGVTRTLLPRTRR
jgi:uncharacterized membrane protein YeaQ/YmgE (transglycosylase-associated protein family)